MANKLTIQHKRSSVGGRIPTAADIDVGELGLNFPDKSIYTKDGSGNIVELARDVYKSNTAPTTDLIHGELWYDTNNNILNSYDGLAWNPVTSTSGGGYWTPASGSRVTTATNLVDLTGIGNVSNLKFVMYFETSSGTNTPVFKTQIGDTAGLVTAGYNTWPGVRPSPDNPPLGFDLDAGGDIDDLPTATTGNATGWSIRTNSTDHALLTGNIIKWLGNGSTNVLPGYWMEMTLSHKHNNDDSSYFFHQRGYMPLANPIDRLKITNSVSANPDSTKTFFHYWTA